MGGSETMARILVCDPIHPEGVGRLVGAGHEVLVKDDIAHGELLEIVDRFHALVVRSRTRVDKEVIERGRSLKAIARAGVGLEKIDTFHARERGIQVMNAPEALTQSVAELTIGLLIALARGIVRGDRSMKGGAWLKEELMGVELSGKTLGIVGFGRIGRRTCELAVKIGMRVMAYEILEIGREYLDRGVRQVTLEELLANSDFITLHVPLTKDTRHLIDAEALRKTKPRAYLVNVARGEVVDPKALEEALRTGRLAGSAIDVYEVEPPSRASLIGLDGVLATPHIGAQTRDAQRKASVIVCDKLLEILGESEERVSAPS
ncbi:MAG: D-2-hydroxyacid dehydrogenase [Candidatus Geothermarchaeales archaeon]